MEKKPKTIEVSRYDYIIRNDEDEILDDRAHPYHFSEFNNEGRPLREVHHNRNGEFEEMITYTYDTDGRLETECYHTEEDEVAEQKVYFYAENGQVHRIEKQYQDGSVDTAYLFYDDAGKLIRKETMNDDEEVEAIEHFRWEGETLVQHEVVDRDGEVLEDPFTDVKPSGESRVTYNEQGQPVQEEELDENGNVFMAVHRSYTAEGRPDETDVFIDGQGKAISRHYLLKYTYTFFE
jgi:antitoxin component YwqK of YwqJK toxin-antitoxin module